MGEIISFYSYKGGTGRSMAVANVGHILAWELEPSQRKVLMIDWDLEAPGLHRYFFDQLKINFPSALADKYAEALQERKGLVDFLHNVDSFYRSEFPSAELDVKYAGTAAANDAFRAALTRFPLEDYVLTVAPPSGISARSREVGLSLMKAGNQAPGSDYVKLVRTFDWLEFYNRYGSFFTCLREYLENVYDVVLINSRTGLTDIGDICTRMLPEKLVTVFVPNEQNIQGLIDVIQGAAQHRLKSRDTRELVAYPLAARINSTASRLRSTWWKGGVIDGQKIVGYEERFGNLFKSIYQLDQCDLSEYFDRTQVPYDSDYAFGERVAAMEGTYDKLSMGFAFANLARQLAEDRAPWEKAGKEDQPMSVVREWTFVDRLARGPTALAAVLIGLFFAVFAPLFEQAIFPSLPVSVKVGDFIASISTSNIAGYGMGRAAVDVKFEGTPAKSERTPTASPVLIGLQVDRGTISPRILIFTSSFAGPSPRAILTSSGLGAARLEVTSSFEDGKNPPPPKSLTINYRWPVAVSSAAFGGIIMAILLHIWTIIRSPFRRPTPLALLVMVLFDVVVGVMGVVVYITVLAPIIDAQLRFHPLLIMLVAVGAPSSIWYTQSLVNQWTSRKEISRSGSAHS